jgi:queuine tRNA-ribosyltransferase
VIHGGLDPLLRKESCDFLTALPFDGFAIGGSLGKTKHQMVEMLRGVLPQIPERKPNHLLGIGDLESLKGCVPLGIDTFDSSYPTRAARHGLLLREEGGMKVERADNANCFAPIERDCNCWTCTHFSVAYLHHLFKAKEVTAHILATVHNLHFMVERMKRYRIAIAEDKI